MTATRSGRRLAALATAVAVAATLGACAASPEPEDSGAPAADIQLITPGVLTIAARDDQPPFMQRTSSGDLEGFIFDLIEDIADRLDLETDYRVIDNAGLLAAVGGGQYDLGAASYSPTPEREEIVDFTIAQSWGFSGLVVKKDSPYQSMADLEGLSVAVVRGSFQEAQIKAEYPEIDAVSFAGEPDQIAALRGGQVDAVLSNGFGAQGYVKDDPDNLRMAAVLPLGQGSAMAVTEGNTSLTEAINEQLIAIVEDGTYVTIWKKWFPENEILEPFIELYPALKDQI